MLYLLFVYILSLLTCNPVYKYSIQESEFGYNGTITLVEGEGPYGNDAKELSFIVYFESEFSVHVKIFDPSIENVLFYLLL
jgi:hypothetical protein